VVDVAIGVADKSGGFRVVAGFTGNFERGATPEHINFSAIYYIKLVKYCP
jgi:hypothetical protein